MRRYSCLLGIVLIVSDNGDGFVNDGVGTLILFQNTNKYPYIDRLGTSFANGYAICLIVFPHVPPLLFVLVIEVGRNHGLAPSVHT